MEGKRKQTWSCFPLKSKENPCFLRLFPFLPGWAGGRESWGKGSICSAGSRLHHWNSEGGAGTPCRCPEPPFPEFPPGSKPAGIGRRRKTPKPAQTGLPPPEALTSMMRVFWLPGAALPGTPKRVILDKGNLSSHRSGGRKSEVKSSAGRHSRKSSRRENPFLPLPASGHCQESLASLGCGSITVPSVFVFTVIGTKRMKIMSCQYLALSNIGFMLKT